MLLAASSFSTFFFFNDTATTEIYTLSLHDALPISEPRLRAAHGLEQLRAGGARLADDVERLVAPVGRHLAAPRVGILGRTDRREEHLRGGHAEAETERAVAIVGIEPIVCGAEHSPSGHQHALVSRAGDLEEDLV